MIREEFLNDNTLVKHYSDRGVKLLQVETGIVYDEPVDVNPCPYTYEETEEKIEGRTEEYADYIQEQYNELKQELLDTQMALCDIYESLEG